MALEAGSFINDLVATNPAAGDTVAQGDDHIRLIKKVLLACFPGLDGALLDADGNILASKAGILAPSLDPIASGNVTLTVQSRFATDANTPEMIIDETVNFYYWEIDEAMLYERGSGTFRTEWLTGKTEGEYDTVATSAGSITGSLGTGGSLLLGWKMVGANKQFLVATSHPTIAPMPIRFYKVL